MAAIHIDFRAPVYSHRRSGYTAVVGLVFLFLGKLILQALDISVGAFAIAGGVILLVFSIKYMTTGHMVEAAKEEVVAVCLSVRR